MDLKFQASSRISRKWQSTQTRVRFQGASTVKAGPWLVVDGTWSIKSSSWENRAGKTAKEQKRGPWGTTSTTRSQLGVICLVTVALSQSETWSPSFGASFLSMLYLAVSTDMLTYTVTKARKCKENSDIWRYVNKKAQAVFSTQMSWVHCHETHPKVKDYISTHCKDLIGFGLLE